MGTSTSRAAAAARLSVGCGGRDATKGGCRRAASIEAAFARRRRGTRSSAARRLRCARAHLGRGTREPARARARARAPQSSLLRPSAAATQPGRNEPRAEGAATRRSTALRVTLQRLAALSCETFCPAISSWRVRCAPRISLHASAARECVKADILVNLLNRQGCAPKYSENFGSELFGKLPKVSGHPL